MKDGRWEVKTKKKPSDEGWLKMALNPTKPEHGNNL